MTQRVVAILGPTASGKSALAIEVAKRLDGEVVSADSMQIYTGMDIGTAKTPPTKRVVAHHLIDVLDPGSPFSAQQFQLQARACFAEIDSRGKVAILCGGTGLYVQAALEDMRFPAGEQEHNAVRQKYEGFAAMYGSQALWDLLNERDAESATRIHPHNVRRVVRALEMADQGVSYAHQVENMKTLPEVVPSIRFALKRDPKTLAQRIDARVDEMFEDGLVEEVQGLLAQGFRHAITAPQAIGYKEIASALDGHITFEQAREDIKTATRRYAKRQRSWLKRDARVEWLDADTLTLDDMTSIIVERYRQTGTIEPLA